MSSSIPQYFINDLLARIDIVEIINASVPLKKSGNNFKACCPFHSEKTPSFTVNQQKQFYYCFGCNAHGTAIGFMMDYSGMGFVDTVEELATRAGMKVPRVQTSQTVEQAKHSAQHYELMELVVQHYCRQLKRSPQSQVVVDYLRRRGLDGALANKFELGFAPPGWDNLLKALGGSEPARQRLLQIGVISKRDEGGYYDRFRNRIIFPIRDQRGRTIGLGGRVLDDAVPKYLNSPETPIFHKGRELYGLYHCHQHLKKLQHVYVVEGYMDVLSLHQHGVHNVVASLGTAVSRDHLKKLFWNCPQLIFCFDGDNAGRQAAWRTVDIILPLLKEDRQVYFMFMPDGDDPDTYISKYGQERFTDRKQCMPLSDYLFHHFSQTGEIDSREGKGRLIDSIVPLIAKLPISGLRELLIKDLSELVEIDIDNLKMLIAHGLKDGKHQAQHKILAHEQQACNNLITNAVCALLHMPELARTVTPESLAGIEDESIAFLQQLLTLIHEQPDISCAGVLEYWRESKYEQRLKALSIKDNLWAELDNIQGYFTELIEKIKSDHYKKLRQKQLNRITTVKDLKTLFPLSTITHKTDEEPSM